MKASFGALIEAVDAAVDLSNQTGKNAGEKV